LSFSFCRRLAYWHGVTFYRTAAYRNISELFAFYVFFQLGDLQTQSDALFSIHAAVRIGNFKVMAQFVIVFFQIYIPDIFGNVKINFDVDTALSNVRI
jgi:hypothetical protein